MIIDNLGDIIRYIRNNILNQPTEELEGDDLTIEIYDNEITFIINDIYDGPTITYNMDVHTEPTERFSILFKKCESGLEDGEATPNTEQIIVAAKILEILQTNELTLFKFLNRN